MAAYRHFADKAALLAAIGEMGFTRFGDALEAAAHSKRGHYARLEELGVAYVRFAMENQAHFDVMFGAGGKERNLSGTGREAADRAFRILLDTVREGQIAGKFSGDDPLPMAQMVWATVHGISSLKLEPDWNGEALFTRSCCKHLRKGIQPR